MQIIYLILIGLAGGFFGGMGMGGGTLLIPLLTLFLGVEQKLAQGLNLLSFLVMAIFSLYFHFKNGFIRTKHIYIIILSGLVFSFGGAMLVSLVPSVILRRIFGGFLVVLSIFEMLKLFKKNK